MKPRVLVVGSEGYLGRHVTKKLDDREIPWLGIDACLWKGQHTRPGVLFYDVTAGVPAEARDFEPDVIIHLAGSLQRGFNELPDGLVYRHTFHSVERIRDVFPRTPLVFSSSMACAPYDCSGNLVSAYVDAKRDAERLLMEEAAPALIFRFGTLYGPAAEPGAWFHPHLLLNQMVDDALNKGEVTVTGEDLRRPVCSVQNAAEHLVPGAIAAAHPDACHATVCVSNGFGRLKDFAFYVSQKVNHATIVCQPAPPREISYGPRTGYSMPNLDDLVHYLRDFPPPPRHVYKETT